MSFRRQSEQSDELTLWHAMQRFLRAWKLMLLGTTLCCAAAAWQHVSHPLFSAQSTLLLERGDNSPMQAMSAKMSGMSSLGLGSSTDASIEQDLLFIGSPQFFKIAAKDLMRTEQYEDLKPLLFPKRGTAIGEWIVQWLVEDGLLPESFVASTTAEDEEDTLANSLSGIVTAEKQGTESIQVKVTFYHAQTAAFLAGFLSDEAVKAIIERDTAELDLTKSFLDRHSNETLARITAIEDAIVSFKKERHLGSVDKLSEKVTDRLSDLDNELKGIETQIEENRMRIDDIRESQPRVAKGSAQPDEIMQKYGNRTTLVRLEKENELYEQRADMIRELLSKAEATQEEIPRAEVTVGGLEKRAEFEYGYFAEVKGQQLQIEIQRASLSKKIVVFERPSPNHAKRSSKLSIKLLIASFIGSLLGLFLSYLLETLKPIVHGADDLSYFKINMIGNIPRFKASRLKKYIAGMKRITPAAKDSPGEIPRIRPIENTPDSPESMAFKDIRTMLLNMRFEGGVHPQVIAAMSPQAGDGKSTLAACLAASFAQLGKRTLLIDCDLRKPALSERLGFGDKAGLGDFLTSEENDSGRQHVRKLQPKLDFMPAGPYHPHVTELLSSEKFAEMIASLRHFYDFVILDTPPIMAAPDAMALSGNMDLIVMSIAQGKTEMNLIESSLHRVRITRKVPLVGVLNGKGAIGRNSYNVSDLRISEAA